MVNSSINPESDLILSASPDGFKIGMRGVGVGFSHLGGHPKPVSQNVFAYTGENKMSREEALATLQQMQVGITAMIAVVENYDK